MLTDNQKKTLTYNFIFIFIGLLIISDYLAKGTPLTEEITKIEILQDVEDPYDRPYNGKTRSSYEIYTKKNSFYCSANFAFSVEKNEEIIYYTSPLFNEVNSYQVVENQKTEYNTFREFYGLQFPLAMIAAIIISFFFIERMYVIDFIAKVFIVLNLVYVLF